ncbi:MAG: response regulator [Bacteroidota bacterium]
MNSTQLKILLADDDKDDCGFFHDALQQLPIETTLTTVSDGEQLMNYLAENKEKLPAVLFLDLNMPRKNGFECLSEIKQDEKLKDLPVVIFSTSDSRDKINSLFKSGAQVYIRKPGDFEQLKEVIHHALPIATEKRGHAVNSLKYILNA